MEAVLLGLTPAVRVADRQSPLAGALRRELAAVTGLAVTPLDLDPRDEGLFDALADALEECQVLVTIGDLEQPGGLRRLLTRGLGLETRIDPDALADAEAWCRAHPEARIAPGELAEVPAIAEVFRTGGVCGFGLRSRQQAILCLPGDPESFLPLLLREGYAFLGSFLGREIYTMELPADGVEKTCPWRWNTIWFPPGQGSGCGSLRRNGGCSIWGRKPPSISCPTRRSRSRNRRAAHCCPQRIRSLPVPDRLPGRSRTAGGSSAGQRLCC